MNDMHIAAFTGHRPQSLPWGFNEEAPDCIAFKKRLQMEVEQAIQDGYSHFLFGGSIGVDLIAARIVLDLKQKYPKIILECIIPYINQAVLWPTEQQDIYHNILAECDKKIILNEKYSRDVYKLWISYMVDRAGLIIAAYCDEQSGSGQTVRYALEREKRVIVINPCNA